MRLRSKKTCAKLGVSKCYGTWNFYILYIFSYFYIFFSTVKNTYYFQIFDGLMKVMEESEADYNPVEWEQYSAWCILHINEECDTMVKTKATKKLLEII